MAPKKQSRKESKKKKDDDDYDEKDNDKRTAPRRIKTKKPKEKAKEKSKLIELSPEAMQQIADFMEKKSQEKEQEKEQDRRQREQERRRREQERREREQDRIEEEFQMRREQELYEYHRLRNRRHFDDDRYHYDDDGDRAATAHPQPAGTGREVARIPKGRPPKRSEEIDTDDDGYDYGEYQPPRRRPSTRRSPEPDTRRPLALPPPPPRRSTERQRREEGALVAQTGSRALVAQTQAGATQTDTEADPIVRPGRVVKRRSPARSAAVQIVHELLHAERKFNLLAIVATIGGFLFLTGFAIKQVSGVFENAAYGMQIAGAMMSFTSAAITLFNRVLPHDTPPAQQSAVVRRETPGIFNRLLGRSETAPLPNQTTFTGDQVQLIANIATQSALAGHQAAQQQVQQQAQQQLPAPPLLAQLSA